MDRREAEIGMEELWLKEKAKARAIRQVKEAAAYMAQCIIDSERNLENARCAVEATNRKIYMELAAAWQQSYTEATNELAHIIDDMG